MLYLCLFSFIRSSAHFVLQTTIIVWSEFKILLGNTNNQLMGSQLANVKDGILFLINPIVVNYSCYPALMSYRLWVEKFKFWALY